MDKLKFKGNPVLYLSYNFSLEIIQFCEILESKRKYIISNQLFRSGTSIGANIFEAQNAESKNDFIHKMKIAAKEMEETEYWLMLCADLPSYPCTLALLDKLKVLARLVGKIITSAIRNNKNCL